MLDQLVQRYHRSGFLSSDPLEFVHRYSDPWDQEAVALVSALLAYGNVKQIRRSVEALLARIEESPATFVRGLSEPGKVKVAARKLDGFVHRFNRGEDLLVLLRLLSRSWKEHGSLGAHFVKGLRPDASNFGEALDALVQEWRSWAKSYSAGDSFGYLLTAPKDGSCCKRWCMFLRWMGRKDELDPGLWTRDGALASTFPKGRFLASRQLVIPIDTHTGRISQYLGLTSRKSLGWLAALEVTESLKACNADDPVRYDFAIARLGILDQCQRKYRAEICQGCDLLAACHFAQKSLMKGK